MRIELTTETLQVFLAKALVHASPNFPTLRLLVSSYIGFYYLKNLLGIPFEKVSSYLGVGEPSDLIPNEYSVT
jgi:hypothetical protein